MRSKRNESSRKEHLPIFLEQDIFLIIKNEFYKMMLTYTHYVKPCIQNTNIRKMKVNLLEVFCLLYILRCNSEIKGSVLYIWQSRFIQKLASIVSHYFPVSQLFHYCGVTEPGPTTLSIVYDLN